ncbi:MAG: recombinase family protein [Defluviitaleaceae bacterium]|nr:recombinase family protein [Defluviitaleaceae bacterium]
MAATHKLNNERINVVHYYRYSSHGQQEQSIEGQARDCRAYSERMGYTVVGEYIDRALSAKTDARPEFRRMISDASKKQFQYVIVWKLDRFARNRFDSAIHKATLKKYGVKVLSVTENIADTPDGILLEGILESMAEHYSANLAENIRRGQRESILKGAHVGGVAPFGFKSVKEGDKLRLVADETNAPIIKYVFDEYAKGVPKKQIMEALTARGLLNSKGNTLSVSCLQNALRNKKYIGVYMYRGEQVEGACDALIDEETFNKVQEMLDSRSHGKNAKRVRQEYLLRGKVFCGHCGSPLTGESGAGKHGKVYFYYTCSERKKRHACDKKNEKKDFLEWYVVEQTIEHILSADRIADISARVVAEYDKNFNDTRIKEYERQVKKLDGEVNTLVDSILTMPKKAHAKIGEKIEVLETQKADIELNLVSLRISNGHRFTKEQIAAWIKNFCRGDELDADFQRRIIDLFINCVYVYDNKIVLYYNVEGGKQVSYIEPCSGADGLAPDNDEDLRVAACSDSEYSSP